MPTPEVIEVRPLTSPLHAILFDLDGTLADSVASIAEALVATLADFGHRSTVAAVLSAFGSNMVEMIERTAPIDRAEAERIYAAYLPRYRQHYMPGTQPLPGADALLADLAGQGVPLGVVTSKIEALARDLVGRLGWSEHFGVVVGRDTTPAMKPSPLPVRHALAALRVEVQRSAFVGDAEEDMAAAAAAGVPVVVGLPAMRSAEQLRAAGASHVCDDLDGVRRLLLPALWPQPA
ncbi:MAG: HAD family hydrolase [Chloroflexi bacterium]|nr:HAD family hydrolase [Chloroflexota bacterium]